MSDEYNANQIEGIRTKSRFVTSVINDELTFKIDTLNQQIGKLDQELRS